MTHNLNLDLCLGIDFGTTNSCISVWYNNKAIIIPDIDGNEVIPTVIEINLGKKIIGKEAYLRQEIFNSNKNTFLIYEIKKLLGKKYSELNKKNINMLAYNVISDENDNILIIDDNNGKSYYPEEIATHLFMSFKLRAETFLSKKFNQEITIINSIISVPAYFNKNQRQYIKNSAEYAGLKVLRLINEPTAAAICYGLGKNSANLNILVFDFGGGTLDVSLLNINDGIYEVLASCGNNNLGGSDFDNRIMEYIIGEFIKNNNINYDEFISNISENSLQKLKLLSEQAKISLSNNLCTKIKIDNFYNNLSLSVKLSRDKFNEICQDLINIIVKPINDVIELCEFDKSDINEIIMVGGMTRIPIVHYTIERYFNKDINSSINPDNVVSIGCSIQGYMILNKNIEDKLLLIDRTSLSIGVETSGGIMDVIIPRGSIIPIKKTKKYSTDTDYMEEIDIKIFEGERKFTKDNFLIGDFTLYGIEKQKKGLPTILITFSIDSDNIIKIYAEDLDNPLNKKSIQVSGNKQNLSETQINDIIENAKIMDEIDKIDKTKKEHYITLFDNSNKIIDNLKTITIPGDIKDIIIENVTSILDWLKSTDYKDIEISKYKEILYDYKINYSIYIIQQSTPILELDAVNQEDDKGIEIYDDDTLTKKYETQINYFRNIIEEYDNINKHIIINKKINNNNNKVDYVIVEDLFNFVYNYASEVLINFFINKNLNDEYVDTVVKKLNELDNSFKEVYNSVDAVLNKLVDKLNEKENYYLLLLDNKVDDIVDDTVDDIKNDILNKLDLIIEFQSYIYKINSGYCEIDYDKISNVLKCLDSI